MTELWLDAAGLARLGKRMGLFAGRRHVGNHYLVHCALGELFQDDAPQPFALQDKHRQFEGKSVESPGGRSVRVLGYAPAGMDTLHTAAQMSAPPPVYEMCDWDQSAAKPMPASFPRGMTLQFELQACPVVRKASAGSAETRNGERSWQKGEELDAFLSEAWENPDEDLDREQVYVDWLDRQLDLRGGASLNAGSVGAERFSIQRMTRRSHGDDRAVHTIKRPDVTLTGRLTVTDSEAFVDLLRSGIGRHKSFGYGMLKVRRA
jgi:CRISPR system Cascade subunit CasE